jgi:hypothetical protein
MKKILLVCDGNHFPAGAFDMIKEKYADSETLVTGVFLNSVQYTNLVTFSIDPTRGLLTTILEEDRALIAKNITMFKQACEKAHLEYRVHQELDFAIFPGLKKETRFADIMLMSSESFYKNLSDQQPGTYTKIALHEAECPVLLVPEIYNAPTHIILSYDGSKDSVYAIKQFAGLFPEYAGLATLLVYVSSEGDEIPDLDNMEELAGRHFSNLSIEKLEFDAHKYFETWLSPEKNTLLVTGSFARSGLSMLFKKSFTSDVIASHEIPVFVTHK